MHYFGPTRYVRPSIPLQTTPGLSRHGGGSFLNRFSPKIGNLHGVIIGELQRVTIRRELMHADQINEFEHGETDRLQKYAFAPASFSALMRATPRPGQAWGRVGIPHGANASPIASNAAPSLRRKKSQKISTIAVPAGRPPAAHVCREACCHVRCSCREGYAHF